jgi:hypothetical protein
MAAATSAQEEELMYRSSFLLMLVPMVTACTAVDDPATLSTSVLDMTAADCVGLPAPFSQNGCPSPATMTAAQKRAKCTAVKTVALAKADNADCADGWIFGPNTELTKCLASAKDKKLCKLSANDAGPGHAAWPAGDGWSQCLNDWVVYCTDNYPAQMGIGASAPVCFVDALEYDDLPVNSVTGREVCQRLSGGDLPDKCDAKLCKPKARARKKTKRLVSTCSPTPVVVATAEAEADGPVDSAPRVAIATIDESLEVCSASWVEEACVPDGVACVEECEPCADDDLDPTCEEGACSLEPVAVPVE